MRHLLDTVLSWEKLDANEISVVEKVFPVKRMLKNLSNQFSKVGSDKGVKIVVEFGLGVPPGLIGDEFRLREVLSNFLSNAMKVGFLTHQGPLITS